MAACWSPSRPLRAAFGGGLQPVLTATARAALAHAQVGTEKRLSVEQRNWELQQRNRCYFEEGERSDLSGGCSTPAFPKRMSPRRDEDQVRPCPPMWLMTTRIVDWDDLSFFEPHQVAACAFRRCADPVQKRVPARGTFARGVDQTWPVTEGWAKAPHMRRTNKSSTAGALPTRISPL